MPYSLGLYVEDNYIKYAKVLKEKDEEPKIDSHGIVFYDNLNMAIEQIIRETYSANCEISTNINNEFYNYFDEVFSGRSDSNLKKYLKLVFAEQVCAEKKINPSSVESRFIASKKKYDDDQQEVMYISANNADIANKKQLFKSKLKKLLPISLANLSLIDNTNETNVAILNIDSYSTLTIILQGKAKKVFNINIGMSTILSKLNQKYNSYAKSYERCKSTTIYTEGSKDALQDIESEADDSELIVPLLYDVGQRVVSLLKEYEGIINKLYVTGTCIAINNIDLYFEEMLNGVNVEILKPNFIMKNLELSNKIKDFTEVNAAIALAISSGKLGDYDINFIVQNKIGEQISAIKENKFISKIIEKISRRKEKIQKTKEPKIKKELNFNFNIVSRGNISITLLLIGYIAITLFISKQYKDNTKIIDEQILSVQNAILDIDGDRKQMATSIQKYNELQLKVGKLSQQLNEINGITYDVPNFLTEVALVIPDDVIITKININANKQIVINAECDTYAPLGFFISNLKREVVMKNIKTQIVSESTNKTSEKGEDNNQQEETFSNIQKIIINGEII